MPFSSPLTDPAALALAAAGVAVGAAAATYILRRPYVPPRVWQPPPADPGNKWANINSHTSGARTTKPLPEGQHPYQLYSLGTPNGVKVTILLEELGVDYDAWLVDIGGGGQFTSGFVGVNPNSKIPALYDKATGARVFESGAILLYLCEQNGGRFLPTEPKRRAECLSWVFWGTGSPPFLGGGFGHFYNYYSQKLEYPIHRYAMETKRQLHVLDTHLEGKKFLVGDEYTVADMAVMPWYGALVQGKLYGAAEFLNVQEYKNVAAWAARIGARPAVVRGKMVNRTWGPKENQLPERHSAKDFDGVPGAH